MYIKTYNLLPREAQKIRETVFVKEQGFRNEFDEFDACARHLVLYDDKLPIATCRFFQRTSHEDYIIGRIAVIKEYRGQHIGSYLLKMAEAEIKKMGGKRIFLHAQSSAEKFYAKQGYRSFGEIDSEENCPHIWMQKKIAEENFQEQKIQMHTVLSDY